MHGTFARACVEEDGHRVDCEAVAGLQFVAAALRVIAAPHFEDRGITAAGEVQVRHLC